MAHREEVFPISNLGDATLLTILDSKKFESDAKRLEADMLARFKRMGAAADSIFSAKSFSGAASGARAVTAAVDPAKKAIDTLRNSVFTLRNETEAYDRPASDQVRLFQQIKSEALEMATSFERGTKAQRDLTGVAATAARSIKQLSGETTTLGLSGNVAVGISGAMKRGFLDLGTAITPLIGAAGIGGLIATTSGFVGEAQRAQSASVLYGKAVARVGEDSDAANALVDDLANTFGILPSTVQDAAIPILRAGGSLEDVSNALRGAGASAAAGGRDIGLAMQNVGRAVATGNSALTEQADIIVNSSDAYQDYADRLGISTDALTEQQKVQAYAAAIAEETKYELEDLSSVMTDQVKAQQNFRTAMAEARQELGSAFAPALQQGATAAASLLKGFDTLPDTMQSSVVSVGGVTTAVGALAVGANGLRVALLPLLAPPAGLLIGGIAVLAGLAVGYKTLYDRQEQYRTGAGQLADAQKALNDQSTLFAEKVGGAADAISSLQDATGEDGLVKALETYASTLDMQGAAATDAFITGTLRSVLAQGKFDEALVKSTEFVLEYERARVAAAKATSEATSQGIEQDLQALEKQRAGLEAQRDRLIAAQTDMFAGVRSALPGVDEANAQYLENVNLELAKLESNYAALYEQQLLAERGTTEYSTALASLDEIQAQYANGQADAEQTLDSLLSTLGLAADEQGRLAVTTADSTTATDNATSSTEDQASATSDLTDETAKLDPALRAVARAQQQAQDSKLDAYYTEVAEAASDLTTSIDALNAKALDQVEADEAAVQAAKDLIATNKEAANSASPYDASGPTALTKALEAAVTASGYMTDAQREANLELREGATSAESFSDSLSGLNEEGRIAGQYFSTAAASASDFTTSLDALNNEALEASTRLRNADTSAESLSDSLSNLNNLAHQVSVGDDAADDLENASEKAELLNKAGLKAVEIFGDLATEILGADSAMGIFAETAVSAISALASGDILGFFASIVDGIVDAATHGQAELQQLADAAEEVGLEKAKEFAVITPTSVEFDEAAYDEYLQYLEAIKTYGQDIADKFYTVGENGKRAFNEEGLAAFADGLERVQDRADGIAEAMRKAKEQTDSVLDAELSARQDTLDAKLAGQDGGYSEADIFEQQAISIGEAAKKRDEAYQEAAELEAAGQADLAARRRAAAEQAYAAEVSQINSEAEGRAEAIGKNSEDFRNRLDQAAQTEGQKWTDYWNQDAAAQLEAQKNAQIQLRRFQQVLNSERYQELLAAGVSEEVAWQTAASELGYTINATSGDLVAATDAASQQQSQAITNSGGLLANAALSLFAPAGSQIATDGAILRGQIAGEGSLLSSSFLASFGATSATAAAQGGALASTVSSVFAQIANTSAAGTDALNTTITGGANLNIGAVTAANNALGQTLVSGGKLLGQAEANKANQLIRQKQEGAKKEAQAEGKLGNELNRIMADVGNAKIKQIKTAAVAQSGALASSYNLLIATAESGTKNYANALAGTSFIRVKAGTFANLTAGLIKAGQQSYKNLVGGNFNADFAEVIDPAKYAEQQAKKVGSPGKAGSGGVGSGGSKGSGSSGGKKDGTSYTGGKSSDYPQGSPGWYRAKIQEAQGEIDRAQKKDIPGLQAKKAKLEAQLASLLGETKTTDKQPLAGSIDYIQEQISDLTKKFNASTNDAEKARIAESLKLLKAELKEKQKLLEDAAKDAQDAVKGTVISIESPLADLGSLKYLAESVSSSVSAIPTSVSSAATASAASVTRIPETYTSTVLPSYQAQMDVAAMQGASVKEFGGYVREFGASIREQRAFFRELMKGGNRSALVDEARGYGISPFLMK